MNIIVLYLVLLKATITSFAGLASLPVVRDELVVQRQIISDAQLTEAVVVTRTTPGPVGLYVVSVGYFAAGVPGAVTGWLAMITPALLIIPLIIFLGRRTEHPRVKAALQTVVITSAALLLASSIPLARDALVDPLTIAIAVVCLLVLLRTHLDTLWIILVAALISVAASVLGIVQIV